MRFRSVTFLAAGLLVGALIGFQSIAQDADKVSLTWQDTVEDQTLVTVDSHIDLQVRGEDIDEMSLNQDVKVVRHQEFAQVVESVTEAGIAKRLTIRCLDANWEQNGGSNPTRGVVSSSIDGKDFTVIRDGQTYTVDVQGGVAVDSADLQGIGHWIELRHLLPEGEVEVRSSWDVDAEKVMQLVIQEFSASESNLTCTLQKVAEEDGEQIAKIRIVGTFKGEIEDGLSATSTVTGEFIFNVTTGSPERFSINAILDAEGEIRDNDQLLAEVTAKAQKLEYSVEFTRSAE